MSASIDIQTRQGCTYTSDTYLWQTPAGSSPVVHARLKWRAGYAPGATVLLSLTDGAGITLSSVTSSGCSISYVIPSATLLALSAGNFIYDLLVDNTDGTTDCVLIGEVTHDQVMTQ